MTESEFEEFIITLGMKYYAPDSTAYGYVEGFQMILRFLERQRRYVLLIGAGSENDTQKLNSLLHKFAADRKSKVVYAQFEENTIQVCIKMTVDSEIDRLSIKDSIGAVFCFCKELEVSSLCKYCGKQKKSQFYTIGGDFDAMCEECFNLKSSSADKKLKKKNRKQKFGFGLIGALIGAFVGVNAYILLYVLGFKIGLGGIIIILAALFGFALLGKRHNKKSVIVCMGVSWFFLLLAEYISNIATFALDVYNLGGSWAIGEAVAWVNTHLLLPEVYNEILKNIAVGTFLILIFGAVFAMLYKATSKPYIKSEKIA